MALSGSSSVGSDGRTEIGMDEIRPTEAISKPVPSEKNEDDAEQKFTLGIRGMLVFVPLAVLTLMWALDGSSISVALPIMAEDLNGTAIEAFWSGTSFLLSSTVFQPTLASLSNIFGRRPLLLFTIALFFVGALIASLAHNFTEILVGRTIQGVGGGGIMALAEVIVTDLVPLRLRGQYYGSLSAMVVIGGVLGPILGGGFSENVTWRWIFYINFPFIGIAIILVVLFLNLQQLRGSVTDKLRRIDYIGTLLFVGSVSSFLIPLSWGGVVHPWSSWHTLVPLIIGLVGLPFFAFYEYRFAADPLIPHSLFNTRTSTVNFICGALSGFILWCALYYLPLYFEAVKGYTPIISGVALFPCTFATAPSVIICSIIIQVTGRYRWTLWLGWLIATVGLGLACILEPSTSTAGWVFILLVPGIGLGASFAAMLFAIQASATSENLALAVAMFAFFRSFGQAVGVAIGGVVFTNQMYTHLLTYPELASLAQSYSVDAAGLAIQISAIEDGVIKHDLREAFNGSLRIVWAVCCAVSGLAGLLSLLTEAYDLNAPFESKQRLRSTQTERSVMEEGKVDNREGKSVGS